MAVLFKGYLPSIGKVPMDSCKTGVYLPEPPEHGDYVGVLYEDIIQLDFDDEDSSKIALKIVEDKKLKCDILKTTRGIHLYFNNDVVKNTSVGLFNAIGLICDVGVGSKNRTIPLRITKDIETTKIINGEEVTSVTKQVIQREWLQTYPILDTIPAYFRPIGKKDYNLRKSTTRNQTLFNYILTLQINYFTKEEIRYTLQIINNYILYEPLDDKEIDSITRDDSFSEKLFFDNKTFYHDRFGNYMLSNSNILKIDNQVHIYTPDHIYSNDVKEFEKQMILKIPFLKDTQRKEVYKYVELQCTKSGEFASPKYLGMRNNILDIETMTEIPYGPNYIINNRIGYDYDKTAYCEIMDKTLTKVCCGDSQIRTLLEEMIGYTLYRKNLMQVCFILTGEGSNGKSTILNCIKKLIGKINYTSLDLRELEETFKPSEMYNKLANIGDDISAKYLESSSVFKKVVTGESFMVQRKYGQPFQMESYATQIFCANELPQVHDKSDGFDRRIVIVPFNAKFAKTDPDYDPFIEDKLMTDESITYLLKLAVEGLRRVIEHRGFAKSDSSDREKEDYRKLNNNILEWFEYEPPIENQGVTDVYLAYQVWCQQNGCMPVKKMNMSKEIQKKFGFSSVVKNINGKSTRVYVKEEIK